MHVTCGTFVLPGLAVTRDECVGPATGSLRCSYRATAERMSFMSHALFLSLKAR